MQKKKGSELNATFYETKDCDSGQQRGGGETVHWTCTKSLSIVLSFHMGKYCLKGRGISTRKKMRLIMVVMG